MLQTPQRRTVVLAANQIRPDDVQGNFLEIVSCTQPDVAVGFDGDQPQAIETGKCYPGPKNGFKSLLWQDTSGLGCTVVYRISDREILGLEPRVWATISSTLTSILAAIVAAITVVSSDGESGQLALDASGGVDPDKTLPAQACREVTFKTPGSTVYMRLKTGAVDASNAHHLMAADVEYTFAVDNCNLMHFYNGDVGAGAIVYYTWRN